MSRFSGATEIADAVLYEGYLLYPYTASARKNHDRWQFGVVMPPMYAKASGETDFMQTEVLIEGDRVAGVEVLIRFLQRQSRVVQRIAGGQFEDVACLTIGDVDYLSWDEAVERAVAARFDPQAGHLDVAIDLPSELRIQKLRNADGRLQGRIVRETAALQGRVRLSARHDGSHIKLRVRVENTSSAPNDVSRTRATASAFLSTHMLLAVDGGAFVSLMDVPPHCAPAAATCANAHCWPVLVAEPLPDPRWAAQVLASPIILYDFPTVAARTGGDTFDGTEIDELLNLSILTLSDAEKREARATDPRSRALIDRAEAMSAERFAELHARVQRDEAPLHVLVRGVPIAKGSRVRLHPSRRADAWDVFLADKSARVQAVYEDFEGQSYVAVTVDDDPASELHEWYGRSFFFYPDEIEPLEVHA